jgi:hypothetical protein
LIGEKMLLSRDEQREHRKASWLRRSWGIINRPMSSRQMDIIAALGLLVFGLTGFVDAASGLGFSKLKMLFVALGVASLARWLKR